MKKLVASFVASAAMLVASPVTVSFVNPGSPAVVDTASNDYVGPYTLNINGQITPAMCMDDFLNTAGTWSANVTAANSANLSNTYLGNQTFNVDGYTFSSTQVYQDEAYLYSKIAKPGADRIDIQDAAWTLMDYVTGHNPHSTSQAVDNILSDVLANGSSFNDSNYRIISEVDPGTHAEQEFMTVTSTPEPASCALLGGSLFFLGMVRAWSRKREACPQAQ